MAALGDISADQKVAVAFGHEALAVDVPPWPDISKAVPQLAETTGGGGTVGYGFAV